MSAETIQPDPVPYRGLHELEITNFRNIRSAKLCFESGLNLIVGANAAGKTSLLEAIYTLGRIKSFRTHLAANTICRGEEYFRLVGQIVDQAGTRTPVGVERSRESVIVHLDRQPLHKLSGLASSMPVQVFSAETDTLINGGPRHRRQILDWALFHVKHEYRELWQRYGRILRQRNAALRGRSTDSLINSWNPEFLDTATRIDQLRRGYLTRLHPLLCDEFVDLLPGKEIEVKYLTGWPDKTSLDEALTSGLERDRKHGFTHYGVHRSDFRLLIDGQDVPAVCSRGQQKMLLVAFMSAQMRLQRNQMLPAGIMLLDDLGSELDTDNRQRILDRLRKMSAQVFITMISEGDLDTGEWSLLKKFHVEQGQIKEML